MNRKFMFGSAALMLALGFTACSSQEDALQTADEVLTEDANFFFNISIANPSEDGSRADYEDGTADEQKINTILFTFYNSQNALIGATNINFNGASNPEGTDYTTNGTTWTSTGQPVGSNTSNAITTVIVPVKVQQGSTTPAKVIAIINRGALNTAFDSYENYTKEKVTLNQAIDNGFLMSNSVYYGTDRSETDAMVATKIENDRVYKTAEAAKNGQTSATIYVERVVSKVKMQMADDWTSNSSTNWVKEWDETGDVNDSKSGSQIAFKAISWALSNNEKESYLIKNFRKNSDYTHEYMNRAEATEALDALIPDWNSANLHRSFWAMSPSYYYGNTAPKSNTVSLGSSDLEYLTTEDVLNGKTLSRPTFNYSLENTRNAEAVTAGKSAIVSSALIVGQYISGSTYQTGTYDKNAPDFYLRRFISANDSETQVMIYKNEDQLVKAFLAANEANPILCVHHSGPTGIGWGTVQRSSADYEWVRKMFVIEHNTGSAYKDNYSYYVTLQLASDAKSCTGTGDYGLLVSHTGVETEDYILISDDPAKTKQNYPGFKVVSIAEANNYLANHFLKTEMGYVEKYDKGLAYFIMPIKHLWDKKELKHIGDQEFKATLGQYGIVRNHVYDLEIKGFEGIGKPATPGEIIIPVPETETYFVKSEIRVNRWRLVPTQSEVLRP